MIWSTYNKITNIILKLQYKICSSNSETLFAFQRDRNSHFGRVAMKRYAVVGLGYVGLGLAAELAKHCPVIGHDIDKHRINGLKKYQDRNKLIPAEALKNPQLTFTDNLMDIKIANFFIVSVATPAIFYEFPDLEPLVNAAKDLAKVIKKGDIIVFESTVYPGTTEEVCIPVLEKESGLKNGKDFHIGYSPERINPGDTKHTLKNITKIISAQDQKTLQTVQETYKFICDKVHRVSCIAAAEAAKLLENTQRDVNIALMNEFSKIMHALNLNTHEVLQAAKTKWGFIPYKPGFVGGHCISIDPHYLVFQAKRHGLYPELLVTTRKVNDGMSQFVVQSLMELLCKNHINTQNLCVGVFGITYKENVVDVRNSLALKMVKELKMLGFTCQLHDPLLEESDHEAHLEIIPLEKLKHLQVAIIVSGHTWYKERGLSAILKNCVTRPIVMDIPNLFIENHHEHSNIIYWHL